MAVYDLYPGYILFDYHSDKAQHKMVVPTRAWNPLGGTGGQGGYEAWDTSDRDAIEMAEDLAQQITDFMPSAVSFDKWTAYAIATPGAPPLPRAGGILALGDGGAVTPGWYQAVQATLTMYDTDFQTVKLVLLDTSSLNNFAPVPFASLDAKVVDIFNEITASTNAWSSRAGNKPDLFRSYRATINNELLKQYWG